MSINKENIDSAERARQLSEGIKNYKGKSVQKLGRKKSLEYILEHGEKTHIESSKIQSIMDIKYNMEFIIISIALIINLLYHFYKEVPPYIYLLDLFVVFLCSYVTIYGWIQNKNMLETIRNENYDVYRLDVTEKFVAVGKSRYDIYYVRCGELDLLVKDKDQYFLIDDKALIFVYHLENKSKFKVFADI